MNAEALELQHQIGSLVIKARKLGYEIRVEFNGDSEYPTIIMAEVGPLKQDNDNGSTVTGKV